MMGATFPTTPIKTDFPRHTSDAKMYVKLEYGENDPTWLLKELDGAVLDEPAPDRRPARRFGFSLRAIAAKVASALF